MVILAGFLAWDLLPLNEIACRFELIITDSGVDMGAFSKITVHMGAFLKITVDMGAFLKITV